MKKKHAFLKAATALLLIVCVLMSLPVVSLAGGASSGRRLFSDVTGQYGFADRLFNSTVKENKNPDSYYWVFVNLDGKSLSDLHRESKSELSLTEYAKTDEAAAAERDIRAEQQEFLSRLEDTGIIYESKYTYTLFTNSVGVRVRYRDVKEISSLSGVKSVTFSEHYAEPEAITTNNANVWSTGIYKTEGIDFDGSGLVVAVLDTGLDSSHAAFRTMPKKYTLTKDTVAGRIFDGNYNAGLLRFDRTSTIDDVYYNEKVPFAYDYADKDSVVYPSYSVHGTHVAGIIAGNLGEGADEYITDADGNPILGKDGNPMTFSGVAPEAQLVICKVFTDREDSKSLGGAETVDILAALEDCVKLGVDVINMSLGSSAGFSEGDDDLMINVYKSIRENGISLVVAASNDYSSAYGSRTGTNLTETPDSATVGSPSTFEEALSVASISGQKSQYMLTSDGAAAVFFNEVSDGNGNKKEFVKELLVNKLGKSESDAVTVKYVAVQLYGQYAGYTGLDVKGKIVLVERGGGGMTFEEKVRIAKERGAIGVIIYNNVSGNINMTIGGVKDIPVCSITMDASKSLLSRINSRREGEITISKSLLGGPFMSDFSSWGPTPSLHLKPEITAHGGEITSAVPGGWDTLSGTSMAAPNMAGAYTLVLQYIREKHPEITDRNEQITLANRLIMSAPVIAYDEYGTPYSPRKQGAGLATIKNAIETEAYIYVDGTDKAKIELGDDKTKSGIYHLNFHLKNMGDTARVYDISTLVMTETVIEDKGGVRTVAEHAYMLGDMCDIVYSVNGDAVTDGKIRLSAGADILVSAKITLNSEARKYLDDNFKNGMYVEGFVTLGDETGEGEVDLSVPFLAFYGDWHSAPMFDLSLFDEDKAKQDDSIPDDEKPQAQVYPTVPLGSYNNGKYIIPLGTYLYEMPSGSTKVIYSSEDKVAVSMYDTQGNRTAYELYSVYAGLLRGAKYMDIVITDAVTGEVVYSETQTNIRKAYSGGSATASASNVLLELSPLEMGLANNRKYNFTMTGRMDRVLDGEYPEAREEDSYSFTFYVDNEAPELIDYRVRFDPYKEGKETKYKVYLDIDTYDNQYTQSVALCYLNTDEMELELLTGEWIPVESSRGGVATVSVDITDYFYSDIDMYIQLDDYALNTRAYHLTNWKTLAEAVKYPEEIKTSTSAVSLDIGEVATIGVTVSPSDAAATNLFWTSSNEKVVKVKNGELYATGTGTATVTVYGAPNTATKNKATVKVTVSDKVTSTGVKLKRLTLGLIRDGDGAMVDPTKGADVNPNTTYVLKVTADPWYYPDGLDIRFSSSSPDVATVDEKTGVVKTLREGTAIITATQYDKNGKVTAIAVSARLNVGPEFVVQNGYLREYHGLGGKVTIPKSLNVYYIYEDAFKGNNNITELEISSPTMEIRSGAFDGMTALRRVILPTSVTFVGNGAFRNCTALEQIDLRSRAITFSTGAFEGCTSLKYINNLVVTDSSVDTKTANILDLSEEQFERTSPQIGTLGTGAFRGCTSLSEVDITCLRVSGDDVFEGCTSLKKVKMSVHTVIGDGMFSGCTALRTVEYTDTNEFTFGSALIPFSGTQLSEIVFANGGSGIYYRAADGCYYTDSTMSTLVFAPRTLESFRAPDSLKVIGAGAFAGAQSLRTLNLGSVEYIGDYAFADTGLSYSTRPLSVPATVTGMGEGVFYGCSSLESVNFGAGVDTVPAYTFALSGLKSFTLSESVTKLGDSSFRYTDMETLDITGTNVTELGDYVFAYSYLLKSAKLPALTKVGYGTFFFIPDSSIPATVSGYKLSYVSFAEGTTDIGSGTFASTTGYRSLTTVVLPDSVRDSVKRIGSMTFTGCTALTELNLGAITSAGDYSFYGCQALKSLDTSALTSAGDYAFGGCTSLSLSDVSALRTIGNYAFSGVKLGRVSLPEARTIGAGAFSGAELEAVTDLTKLETIGDRAFENTSLRGVLTFPATLRSERGAVGKGVFAGTGVTKIALAGENSVYSVIDGVLFSRLPNGKLQLDAYAPAASAKEYTVPAGVARIGDEAFRGAGKLERVTFNADIAAIGDKAFYGCSADTYVFTGLTAPVLEAYIADLFETDAQRALFTSGNYSEEKFYANFSDYAALVLYPEVSGTDDLGMTVYYPANAAGFGNRAWELFFGRREQTPVIAEDSTKDAIEKINSLPGVDEINAIVGMADKTAARELLDGYKATVGAARAAYNKVTNADQLAFIENADKLFAAETAIRAARTAMGEQVKITELRVKTSPTKLVYKAGELFDATGMVLTVIYDDGSQETVSEGFTLPTEPLKEGQQSVKFSYRGIEKEISLTVNKGDSPTPTPTPDPTPDNNDENGLPVGAVIGIVAGACVLVLAVTALVIVLLKKRRSGK